MERLITFQADKLSALLQAVSLVWGIAPGF